MSDVHLRGLEHRYKGSDSIADEASHLAERVRVGQLERKKLELAAHLGHEAARQAVAASGSLPKEMKTLDELCDWASGMKEFGGIEALLRAVIVIPGLMIEYSYADVSATTDNELWNRQALLRSVERLKEVVVQKSTLTSEEGRLDEEIRSGSGFLLIQVIYEVFGYFSGLYHETQSPLHFVNYELTSFLNNPEAFIDEKHPVNPRVLESNYRKAPKIIGLIQDSISSELLPWALDIEDPLLPIGVDDDTREFSVVRRNIREILGEGSVE